VAQVVECLPSKHKVLSSIPSIRKIVSIPAAVPDKVEMHSAQLRNPQLV
jgi:hypothetical protein